MKLTFEQFEKLYPVVVANRVAWGEMDAYAHLNNIVFFRYFENARIDFFNSLGNFRSGLPESIGPILADTSCKYKAPVTFPDTCYSGARVTEIREYDFLMEYAIFSKTQNCVVATGTGRVVSYDYVNNCKAPVTPAWRAAIQKTM